jgi:hypothetical protein
MNRIKYLTAVFLIIFFSLFMAGCADPLKRKASADLLVGDIYKGLIQFQGEIGDFTINVPKDIEGYLVISAPYAVVSVDEIAELENGALINEEMVASIQQNGGYHLFILDQNKIVTYQKWSSSPVAFNGFYYTRLEKNSTVTMKLGDKVLKSIAHVRGRRLVE